MPQRDRLRRRSFRAVIAIHLRRRIALERRYQWGGEVLFYVCAGCHAHADTNQDYAVPVDLLKLDEHPQAH